MNKLSGGDAIVKTLIAQGIDTIFGLPGVQNDALYNALYDHKEHIRVLHTRHEQGAAYMALGYALSTDRPGVYSVVPGPGLLNSTAALSTAYATNAKVFCLTSEIPSVYIGRGIGQLHEINDQLGVIRSLTKWAARITSPAEAPLLVTEAIRQLNSGRPRPVGLECPWDVLQTTNVVDKIPAAAAPFYPAVDTEAVEKAAKLLGQARNPMIFVGRGAMNVSEEVRHLAEMIQAPVIGYRTGRGILDSRHYLSHPNPAAHTLWPKVDVVLALGSRLQIPQMSWGVDDDLTIIRIDVDPVAHNRIATPDLSIVARSEDTLPILNPLVEKHNRQRPSREAEMLELKATTKERFAYLEPQISFLNVIREELGEDGIFVDELTQIGYTSRQVMPVYKPYTFISTGYQGTLGWGFATALGVKVAHPDTPVISVTGDGGFMFNVQELASAVQHQIGLVTLLFNDNAFGNVQRMQKHLYGNRVIASDLHNPDFVKMADAFGAQGLRAHTPKELRAAIRKGFAENGPTLIEIPVGDMPSVDKFKAGARVR
jgi:acetolactate synthase-1/2/3 large subunit